MSKCKHTQKMVVVFLILIIIFSFSNPVFAYINEDYYKNSPVSDGDIDSKINDSVVIDALATFVNALASMVENLVGKAFEGLTGVNTFPWADRILFNAIPMLDVNIFNPYHSSLFKTSVGDDGSGGEYTPLAEIVRDTYFTILTIAVAFLTIVVGVAAAKLALTSIASEKAKYKEAITKWMLSIVLLFLIHNLMSFVFWTNEKMVEVASKLLSGRIEQANLDLLLEITNIDNAKALENFLEANKSNIDLTEDEANYLKNNSDITYELMNDADYQDTILFDAFADASHTNRNWFKELFTGNGKQSVYALKRDVELLKGGTQTYSYSTAGDGSPGNMTEKVEKSITIDDVLNSLNDAKTDNEIYETDGYKYFRYTQINAFLGGDSKHADVSYYKRYVSVMNKVYTKMNAGTEIDANSPDLIATLGEYFKESAYTVPYDEETGELTGWSRNKLTVQGALLYAIFVFQSIFYFFSYIKRFFYIVVLVVMAPAIVVLDFLRKAIS